jgi:hypothetical protein
MAEKHADQGFRKLPQTLKPMTWKQRFDHLWEYYRFTFFVVAACVIIGVSLMVDVIMNHQVVLFAGTSINVTVSEEETAKLNEELLAIYEGDASKKEVVTLNVGTPFVTEGEPDMEQVYVELMRVVSQISAKELDYLLLDKNGMDYFVGAEAGEDLRTLVSEEYYKLLEPYVVMGKLDEVDNVPVAVSIKDTEFAKVCARKGEELYLMFPGNTGRSDRIEAFLRHILGQ